MPKRTARPSRLFILLSALGLLILAVLLRPYVVTPILNKVRGYKTVEERQHEYGPAARARLMPYFAKAGVDYPPQALIFVGLKQEEQLQIYAAGADERMRFVRAYPIQAASGEAGPKLREGDGQVPEGIYPIESLNPNSQFHLSLRIGYPNAWDRAQAEHEGRTQLGGDIMIRGGAASVGCLAMGDEAAEDLFILAADTGAQNITVVLSPVDFRAGKAVPVQQTRPWVDSLYATIQARLRALPEPG